MSPTEVEHMPIRLHVYLEGTPSGAVWWSESPDVLDFTLPMCACRTCSGDPR